MMYHKVLIAIMFIFISGCAAKQEIVKNTCGAKRTDLDGVCVRLDVADFASCVRSQRMELGVENNKKLMAEIGYIGTKVSGASEFSNKLSKRYSASDEVMIVVIKNCNSIVASGSPSEGGSEDFMKVDTSSGCNGSIDMYLDCTL